MDSRSDDLHPVPKTIAYILAAIFIIYALWGNVIAFVGGTLPVLGITIRGGLLMGFAWLFIIDPIIMTVGYWISMILVLPVAALIEWLGK